MYLINRLLGLLSVGALEPLGKTLCVRGVMRTTKQGI